MSQEFIAILGVGASMLGIGATLIVMMVRLFGALRTEFRDGIEALRTELKGDIEALRTELKGGIVGRLTPGDRPRHPPSRA